MRSLDCTAAFARSIKSSGGGSLGGAAAIEVAFCRLEEISGYDDGSTKLLNDATRFGVGFSSRPSSDTPNGPVVKAKKKTRVPQSLFAHCIDQALCCNVNQFSTSSPSSKFCSARQV